MFKGQKIIKTYTAERPLHVAGFLSAGMDDMPDAAFITTSTALLRKICVDTKRDYNKDHPGGLDGQGLTPEQSGEKTLNVLLQKKQFLMKPLLIDEGAEYQNAALLTSFNLDSGIAVIYAPG